MSEAYNSSLQDNKELTFLGRLHQYLETAEEKILGDIDILLRSEYALNLGAFDDYLHSIMLEHMVKMFSLELEPTKPFKSFQMSMSIILDILEENDYERRKDIYREKVSERIHHDSYLSEKAVDYVVKMIGVEKNIWELSAAQLKIPAKEVKELFNKAIKRRNAIVHEMDKNTSTGSKNPITTDDVNKLIRLIVVIRSVIEHESSEIIKNATQDTVIE